MPSNALALALSAQVSFGLNAGLTWHDTWEGGLVAGLHRPRLVASRWVRYMGAVVVTATLNEALYAEVQRILPAVIAAAICSTAIAALNFAIGDRLVFTRNRSRRGTDEEVG